MADVCRVFLSRPGPSTAPVQCTIVRDTSTSKVYPTYSLYLDDPSELIMAARKRKKSKTANYIISVDDQVPHSGAKFNSQASADRLITSRHCQTVAVEGLCCSVILSIYASKQGSSS